MSNRFIGIGINRYRNYDPLDTPARDVITIAERLAKSGFEVFVATTPEDSADPNAGEDRTTDQSKTEPDPQPSEADVAQLINDALLTEPGSPADSAVFYWAGHGEKAGQLKLVAGDTAKPPGFNAVEPERLADALGRSGFGQCLLIVDTCYSGRDVLDAILRVEKALKALPDGDGPTWFGVIASAGPDEVAYDGVFASRLTKLLAEGPDTPSLRLRWNAYREGVRGDDVLDALFKEWEEPDHHPVYRDIGDPQVMIPNPNYDPNATAQVVEHLLLAATSTDRSDRSSFFSGRQAPMTQLVDWVQERVPGVIVVTGPPGSGKSSLVGRVVALSNENERDHLLSVDPPDEGTDPGENSIAAHVHLRGLRADDVIEELDAKLTAAGLIPAQNTPRNKGELHGAIAHLEQTPVIVVDGLDEAGDQAQDIAGDVIQFLAEVTTMIVASRHIVTTNDDGVAEDLLEELLVSGGRLIDLGDEDALTEERTAIRTYVSRRLREASDRMDADLVATHVSDLPRQPDEGLFLLARLISGGLAANPIDTSEPGWADELASTIEEAFEADILATELSEAGDRGQAALDLLTGLAFSYGGGVPDDLWPVFARTWAVSEPAEYDRDDAYAALEQLGRYVSVRSEAGQAVFRLTHQRLTEHLIRRRLTHMDVQDFLQLRVDLAQSLVGIYLGSLDQGTPPRQRPYLWSYAWRHCADAGEAGIEELRRLVAAEPEFRHDLALGLEALAQAASSNNQPFVAVAPTEEAVTVYRELAATNPAYVNELARSLNNLGIYYSEIGQRHEAVAPTEEAATIYRELAATNPAYLGELASSLNNLGIGYSEIGQRHEAVAPTEEAATIYRELAATNPAYLNELASSLNNLGNRYSEIGQRHEAVAPTEEAATIYRELAATNPAYLNELASSLNNLGNRYSEIGQRHEAVAPTEEAATIYRELAATNPAYLNDLAMSLNNLGIRYSEIGQRHEAVAPTEEAITIRRELAATNPAYLNDLAMSLNNLGIGYSNIGQRHEAVAPTEEAITIRRELAATNPAYLGELARSLNNLGIYYSNIGQRHEAVAPTEEAATIYRELAATNPAYLNDLAMSLNNLGGHYSNIGQRHEAVAPTEEAITIRRELAATNPAYLNDLASSLNNLGNRYSEIGQRHEAVAPTEEAITIRRELAATNPAYLGELARSLNNLGGHYSEIGQRHEAVAPTEEAVTIYRELAATNPAYLGELARSLNNLGGHYSEIGQRHEAVAPTEEAVTIYRELAATNPAYLNNLARSLNNLGGHYSEIGQRHEAVAPTEEAVTIRRELAATNPAYLNNLASSLNNLGNRYSEIGEPEERIGALWLSVLEQQPAAHAALLLVQRNGDVAESSQYLCQALTVAAEVGDPGLGLTIRNAARARRADDPDGFDRSWQQASGDEPPPWLLVDNQAVAELISWYQAPDYASEAELLRASPELATHPDVGEIFDELASVVDVSQARERLAAVAEHGVDDVYHPLINSERLADWTRLTGIDELREALDEHDLATSENVQFLGSAVSAAEDGDRERLTTYYWILELAVAGHEDMAFESLGEPETAPAALDQLLASGDIGAATSLAQLTLSATRPSHTTSAEILIRFAIAAHIGNHPEQATAAVHQARQLSPGNETAWLAFTATHIPSHPGLVDLNKAFLDPLPEPPEADQGAD